MGQPWLVVNQGTPESDGASENRVSIAHSAANKNRLAGCEAWPQRF